MANRDIQHYNNVAIALHWIVAIGVIIMIGLGWYMVDIPKGTPSRSLFFNTHKSIGLTVGIIALIRLLWRATHPAPPLPAGTPRWTIGAAHASHALLYFLLIFMPTVGFIASNFSKYGVNYFQLVKIGPFFAEDKKMYDLFQGMHEVAATVLVVVIAVHVLAAFKHLLVDRDGVFQRMMPGGSR
jgi:cytochrome b561